MRRGFEKISALKSACAQSYEISTNAGSGTFLAESSLCVTSSKSRSETEEAEDVDEELLQPTLAAAIMPKMTKLQTPHISIDA